MKTILIIGANKGIGFETAKQLARLNYFVYLGCRNYEHGLQAVKNLNDLGITNVENIQIDVTDINSVRQARQGLEFLPLLAKSEQSSIINVSSEVGSLTAMSTPPGNSGRDKYHAYGSSKTALNAFTVMLANELRHSRISVNSVTPGHTATDLNQFHGTKTVKQGVIPIVKLATQANPDITGKFFKDGGEAAW